MVQTIMLTFGKVLANRMRAGLRSNYWGGIVRPSFNQGHTCMLVVGVRSLMLIVPVLLSETPLGYDRVPGLGRQVDGHLFCRPGILI